MPSNGTPFPSVKLSIESGLVSPGDCVSFKDVVAVPEFSIGGREVVVGQGIPYDVVLTNTGDGILASGMASLYAKTTCDRCLGEAVIDVSADISCYFLHEEPDGEVDDEEDFGLIDASNGTIDLSEVIQGSLAMEIPYVVLCDEECKGLCPQCGANLNEAACGCVIVHDPDFDRPNPFAALAALKFDADDVADETDDDEDGEIDDEEFERAWDALHGPDSTN